MLNFLLTLYLNSFSNLNNLSDFMLPFPADLADVMLNLPNNETLILPQLHIIIERHLL